MKELLLNVTPAETRVALVDQGVLQEIYIERAGDTSMVGNIYRGRVTRVMPGMQAAFVDIGCERSAFLHMSSCKAKQNKQEEGNSHNILSAIIQGQDVLVQVIKDPIGSKGARLTTDIMLPSEYLVFMPGNNRIGISQKIESEQEHERLRKIMQKFSDKLAGGFIVRTAAAGVPVQELEQDASSLEKLWLGIKSNYIRSKAGSLLHEDLAIECRILRDFVAVKLDKIRVDSQRTYNELCHYAAEYVPEIRNKLEYYAGDKALFEEYDLEKEINLALNHKVDLKSGGSLVIDQTEAMTTIDVNTAAFVGQHNLEETIFNTNIEAASAIARQLRLRNLGGIIIIDFIDMESAQHRELVLQELRKALSSDRVPTNVFEFSPLGLVEMTRKRTRESLGRTLLDECPECHGLGMIKNVVSVCHEIIREIIKLNKTYKAEKFIVYAATDVANMLEVDKQHALQDLEKLTKKKIVINVELRYSREKFDVVMA